VVDLDPDIEVTYECARNPRWLVTDDQVDIAAKQTTAGPGAKPETPGQTP
jgi:hypothetical protein